MAAVSPVPAAALGPRCPPWAAPALLCTRGRRRLPAARCRGRAGPSPRGRRAGGGRLPWEAVSLSAAAGRVRGTLPPGAWRAPSEARPCRRLQLALVRREKRRGAGGSAHRRRRGAAGLESSRPSRRRCTPRLARAFLGEQGTKPSRSFKPEARASGRRRHRQWKRPWHAAVPLGAPAAVLGALARVCRPRRPGKSVPSCARRPPLPRGLRSPAGKSNPRFSAVGIKHGKARGCLWEDAGNSRWAVCVLWRED